MTIENVAAYNGISPVPKKREHDTAERLQLLHGLFHAQESLDAGKLMSLLPTRYGKHILDCQREVSYRKSCQQLPKV